MASHVARSWTNAVDLYIGGGRLDYLQGREHRSGMGIYDGDAATRDGECCVSFLYPVGHVVVEYIHRDNACCGVATERKRAWAGNIQY